MWRIVLALPLLLLGVANAQELSLFAGGVEQSGSKDKSTAWAFEYQHPLHENITASLSWLNEGHLPEHHRDGLSFQIWGRTNVLDRRLSLAVGLGPYYYFDTSTPSSGGDYTNAHGFGAVGSLAATYYTDSRWLYQLRFNRIVVRNGIDTSAVMLGIGYQLKPVPNRGLQASVPSQLEKTTTNEVSASFGSTIVNSYHSEHASAWALEYRRGLGRYVDVTVGYLNEGDTDLVQRQGVAAQIWGVREFLASNRLVLGVGVGPYLAIDKKRTPGESDDWKLSWMLSTMATYRIDGKWNIRASWNRVGTNYDRDTDVILLGVGYRY